MADRKKRKARAWSAKRAQVILHAEQSRAFDRHINGVEATPGADAIDERHLARAYLAGIKAAVAVGFGASNAVVRELHDTEQARLGMPPKPTGTGKGGKRGRGEGRG